MNTRTLLALLWIVGSVGYYVSMRRKIKAGAAVLQEGDENVADDLARSGQKRKNMRWLRATGALLFGLLWLMAVLPDTVVVIAGHPSNPKMWHWGRLMFYPGEFFGAVGIIAGWTAFTVFGIVRRNSCEFIGWALLGLVFIDMFFT